MKHKVCLLGAGSWGTAVAKTIAEKGYPIVIWSHSQESADDINLRHVNSRYLPRITLPENLKAVTNLHEAALDADFIILATPSLYIEQTVKNILSLPNIQNGHSLIGVLTKGFLPGKKTPYLIVETLETLLPEVYQKSVVYISGPSHAEELAKGKITGLISACSNPRYAIRFRKLLNGPRLRVFVSMDVIGVQICAAVKNVIAIAYGIMDALKEKLDLFGDNTESLLLASGLNEIRIVGQALGATHLETFTSIAGVGDLDVTCRSVLGRNRRFGREIILKDILKPYSSWQDLVDNIHKLDYLPEGIVAAGHVWQLSCQLRLKIGIIPLVYRILNKEIDPINALEKLIDQDVAQLTDTMILTDSLQLQ